MPVGLGVIIMAGANTRPPPHLRPLLDFNATFGPARPTLRADNVRWMRIRQLFQALRERRGIYYLRAKCTNRVETLFKRVVIAGHRVDHIRNNPNTLRFAPLRVVVLRNKLAHGHLESFSQHDFCIVVHNRFI